MRRTRQDRSVVRMAIAAALIVGVGIVAYSLLRESPPALEEPQRLAPPPIVEERERPTTPPPVPAPADIEPPPLVDRALPLPALDESDEEVRGGLTEMFGSDAVQRHLVPERVIRNVVVTIDNLPREALALQQRPFKSVPGDFIVDGDEDDYRLSPANYDRYKPLVDLIRAIDAKTLVAWYRGLQPLFQEAYEDLGHPNAFFNTRLLEVIDHLLATPEPSQPIRLVRPSVMYKFADEKLESLSAGQKLLIRMGPENAAVVKQKLRELQAELI
jgi:hypothetical protein